MEVKEEVLKNEEDEKKEIKVGLFATIACSMLFFATIVYMIYHALVNYAG